MCFAVFHVGPKAEFIPPAKKDRIESDLGKLSNHKSRLNETAIQCK